MREALVKALSGFAGGEPLRDCAAGLFGALGYRSERTAEVGSVDEFIELLESKGRQFTDRQRARFDGWRNVEIVFQFTGDEIATPPGLFDKSGFDDGRIESFLFLAVDMVGRTYTRTRLIEITRAVNSRFSMPVILLFRHGSTLTLAVVHRRPNRRDAARDVLEKVTLIKDIRFERPHRAHIEILADLALHRLKNIHSFHDLHAAWETALDIEELNRRFYKKLFHWFEQAVEQCRFPDDGAGKGSTERHIIRLITRLLFAWFMREKGLIPAELFENDFACRTLENYTPDGTDYYRAVLQNLFFATLNTEIDVRTFGTGTAISPGYRYRDLLADPDRFVEDLKKIPFVNGGLFDCLDDFAEERGDGRRIDAFGDNKSQDDLSVPTHLFLDPEHGLFPLFRRYKFTVEENTPLDEEVALDPELLGRAFENLLAAYNPETRDTARKATGSYYTPRHIVDYMVREALVETLAAKAKRSDCSTDQWRDRLVHLLDWKYAHGASAARFDADEIDSLVRAIANLKTLDPAVGSGAFPMGVLQTLTLALRRLDPDNELWEEFQKGRARARAGEAFDTGDQQRRDDALRGISDTFEKYRQSDYGRKLYLIQNGIYGVDIQPIACQIAKLRFFISLAIEQDPDPNAPNLGIRPLPNLETRFVVADTLIGLQNESAALLIDDQAEAKQRSVAAVRERYFLAESRQKKHDCVADEKRLRDELRTFLEANRKDWIAAQKRDIERKAEAFENPKTRQTLRESELAKFARRQCAQKRAFDDACKVAEWDPYDQNARARWFDPGWMFGVTGGFDVVIGNPPYVQLQKDGGRVGDMYEGAGYETFLRTGDIYQLFYERGCGLLRSDAGTLAYITSNSWLKAKYGGPLRHWLAGRHTPLRLVEMGKDVFDAVVDAAVLLIREGGGAARMPAVVMDRVDGQDLPDATERWNEVRLNGEAPWSILSAAEWRVFNKMKAKGTPLKDWNVRINYGVKTGYNDAFIVDSATREALIAEDPRSEKILKPVLRGRDVQRWRAQWAEKWLIATLPSLRFDIDDYPAVKKHLLSFGRERLEQNGELLDGGVKARKKTNNAWFETQDTVAYHEDFSEEKLLWIELVNRGRFAYDDRGLFGEASAFVLSGECLKFLCAVLNAKLMHWFLRHTAPTSGMGVLRWKKVYVEAFPIPNLPSDSQFPFVRLVDDILAAKDAKPDADTSAQEEELDRMVYALYGLTDAEIASVEKEQS